MADVSKLPEPLDTAESLAVNREGRISDAHRERIRAQMKGYLRSRYLLMSISPAIGLLVTVPIAVASHFLGVLWVAFGMTVLVTPLVALVRFRVGRVYADLDAGKVESVTGPEAGRFVNSSTGEAYLRIGQVRMVTFGAIFDRAWRLRALIGGHHDLRGAMRAYYLPQSKLLIAVESPDAK